MTCPPAPSDAREGAGGEQSLFEVATRRDWGDRQRSPAWSAGFSPSAYPLGEGRGRWTASGSWVVALCLAGLGAVACDDGGAVSTGTSSDATADASASRDWGGRDGRQDAAPGGGADPGDAPPAELDGGSPDTAPSAMDSISPPIEVHAINTRIGAPSTVAGLSNRVTCVGFDAAGEPVPRLNARVEVRPSNGWLRSTSVQDPPNDNPHVELTGVRAGTYYVACIAPDLGLRDATPVRWNVLSGPPQVVHAVADAHVVEAGKSVTVNCLATDAEGNPVDPEGSTVVVNPAGMGGDLDGHTATFTRTGDYVVGCALPGAHTGDLEPVTVVSALPASIDTTLFPERRAYPVGQIVELMSVVTDAYGNLVEGVPLVWASEPPLPAFGNGRVRPEVEGLYAVSVAVDGPTQDDRPLVARMDLVADAGGPLVTCTEPAPNTMVPLEEVVWLEGRVADRAGIHTLTVDGEAVALDAAGRFAVQVQGEWGLNVHRLVAQDALGNENNTFCAYFAADRYVGEQEPLADAIVLAMAPEAIEDGPPSAPLSSIGDLLRRVVASEGILDAVDRALRAQNPIVPVACRQRVLGLCVFSLGAEYQGWRMRQADDVTLSLVPGGLRVWVRLEDLSFDVRLRGDLSNSGEVRADAMWADLTFDVRVEGGLPQTRLARINALSISRLEPHFNGTLTGSLLDLVFVAFERTVRETAVSALHDHLVSDIDVLIADLFGGLTIGELGGAFVVPGVGRSPPTSLSLGLELTRLDATRRGLVVGISTIVRGDGGEAGRSAGVPVPIGAEPVGVRPDVPLVAGVSMGFLNQILHRMWRSGAFQFELVGGQDGLPDETRLAVRLVLPPAVSGEALSPDVDEIETARDVRVHMGPAVGELTYPGLFDEPLRFSLAGTARTHVALAADGQIRFGPPLRARPEPADEGAQADESGDLAEDGDDPGADDAERADLVFDTLALRFEGVTLSSQTQDLLEQLLMRVLEAAMGRTLNAALPSLPIPDFALPARLNAFGVPQGTRLGLRHPALRTASDHWRLEGTFGQ